MFSSGTPAEVAIALLITLSILADVVFCGIISVIFTFITSDVFDGTKHLPSAVLTSPSEHNDTQAVDPMFHVNPGKH
jgi:hypothetical protein